MTTPTPARHTLRDTQARKVLRALTHLGALRVDELAMVIERVPHEMAAQNLSSAEGLANPRAYLQRKNGLLAHMEAKRWISRIVPTVRGRTTQERDVPLIAITQRGLREVYPASNKRVPEVSESDHTYWHRGRAVAYALSAIRSAEDLGTRAFTDKGLMSGTGLLTQHDTAAVSGRKVPDVVILHDDGNGNSSATWVEIENADKRPSRFAKCFSMFQYGIDASELTASGASAVTYQVRDVVFALDPRRPALYWSHLTSLATAAFLWFWSRERGVDGLWTARAGLPSIDYTPLYYGAATTTELFKEFLGRLLVETVHLTEHGLLDWRRQKDSFSLADLLPGGSRNVGLTMPANPDGWAALGGIKLTARPTDTVTIGYASLPDGTIVDAREHALVPGSWATEVRCTACEHPVYLTAGNKRLPMFEHRLGDLCEHAKDASARGALLHYYQHAAGVPSADGAPASVVHAGLTSFEGATDNDPVWTVRVERTDGTFYIGLEHDREHLEQVPQAFVVPVIAHRSGYADAHQMLAALRPAAYDDEPPVCGAAQYQDTVVELDAATDRSIKEAVVRHLESDPVLVLENGDPVLVAGATLRLIEGKLLVVVDTTLGERHLGLDPDYAALTTTAAGYVLSVPTGAEGNLDIAAMLAHARPASLQLQG